MGLPHLAVRPPIRHRAGRRLMRVNSRVARLGGNAPEQGPQGYCSGIFGVMLILGLFHSSMMLSIRYRWFVREGDGYRVLEKGNALRAVGRITAGFSRNTPSPGGPNTPRCGVVVGRHGCRLFNKKTQTRTFAFFLPFSTQLRLRAVPPPLSR